MESGRRSTMSRRNERESNRFQFALPVLDSPGLFSCWLRRRILPGWAFAVLLSVLTTCGGNGGSPADGPDWYKRVVFYQIFPRSFKDSDGDGNGDLKGIEQKIPYLADLGIGAVWMCPVYPSPFFDSGYDVADYTAINPMFGDMEAFDDLVAAAHKHGIRIMMDIVFNHTSIDHAWFAESRASRDNPKRDWYLWSDKPFPFNCYNIQSVLTGPEWTLDSPTGQFYFHRWYPQQPELNFRNAAMKGELLNVVRFWLNKGVDGFRLDVPYMYYEGPEGCDNQPVTYEFLEAMRAVTDQFPDKTMVGEIWQDAQELMTYLGNGGNLLQMVFNVVLFPQTYLSFLSGNAGGIVQGLQQTSLNPDRPAGGRFAPFLESHDWGRSALFLLNNPARIKLAAIFLLSLPGTPFVYYGQEIGMLNGHEIKIDFRDTMRTPMQWNTDAWAGFTTAAEPWIGMGADWRTRNVAVEDQDEDSILSHYRNLIHLRNRTPALYDDATRLIPSGHRNLLIMQRGAGPAAVLVVLNLKDKTDEGTLDLSGMPWKSGKIRDLLTGTSLEPLTEENRAKYPFAISALQGWILSQAD